MLKKRGLTLKNIFEEGGVVNVKRGNIVEYFDQRLKQSKYQSLSKAHKEERESCKKGHQY